MASRAHERAQRILGNPTEAQLAELIMHDVSALAGNAGGKFGAVDFQTSTDRWSICHESNMIAPCRSRRAGLREETSAPREAKRAVSPGHYKKCCLWCAQPTFRTQAGIVLLNCAHVRSGR